MGWYNGDHGEIRNIICVYEQRRKTLLAIQKKLFVDEHGHPQEVLISWQQVQQISEMLGLDLDEEAMDDLRQARRDRAMQAPDAYVKLDAIGA